MRTLILSDPCPGRRQGDGSDHGVRRHGTDGFPSASVHRGAGRSPGTDRIYVAAHRSSRLGNLREKHHEKWIHRSSWPLQIYPSADPMVCLYDQFTIFSWLYSTDMTRLAGQSKVWYVPLAVGNSKKVMPVPWNTRLSAHARTQGATSFELLKKLRKNYIDHPTVARTAKSGTEAAGQLGSMYLSEPRLLILLNVLLYWAINKSFTIKFFLGVWSETENIPRRFSPKL